MKTLHTILALGFGLFSSANAADFANFSGHWKGPGLMTDSKGNKTPCANVELKITQTPDSMKIDLYDAQCGALNSNWGNYSMTLKDGKVFEDEDEIGEIQENIMKTLSTSGGVQYAFNLRINDKGASLDSYYGVRNMLGAIVIEGNMKPVLPPSGNETGSR